MIRKSLLKAFEPGHMVAEPDMEEVLAQSTQKHLNLRTATLATGILCALAVLIVASGCIIKSIWKESNEHEPFLDILGV